MTRAQKIALEAAYLYPRVTRALAIVPTPGTLDALKRRLRAHGIGEYSRRWAVRMWREFTAPRSKP